MRARSRKALVVAWVAALAVTCPAAPVLAVQPPQPAPQGDFLYTVKYLCSNLQPFPTVFHWTDINILNPSPSRRATVIKKFVASGTQDQQSSLEPVRDEFVLGPNQAAAIDCDEIQTQLGLPLSTPLNGFVEIRSDRRLTVVGIYDKCVPERLTDVFMQSRLTTDLTLDGFGTFQGLELSGPVIVNKSPKEIDLETNRFHQGTEIVAMELEGTLDVQGREVPIRLLESPRFQSEGRIVGKVDPSTLQPRFPALSSFRVFFEIDSPDPRFREAFGRIYNVDGIEVQAFITDLPPGRPLELLPLDVDRELMRDLAPDARVIERPEGLEVVFGEGEATTVVDPPNVYCPTDPRPTPIVSSRSPARPVGQVSNHCHGPNPPTQDPPEHAKVPCADASIDVEYIEPHRLRGL